MTSYNPLIENDNIDTLENIQTVLRFVHDVHYEYQFSNNVNLTNVNIATALIIKWVDTALTHEINRLEKEATPPIVPTPTSRTIN